MTAKLRIQRLEKHTPKPKEVNPYMTMPKAELLTMLKKIVESGEPIPDYMRGMVTQAKNILRNNGVEFIDKGGVQ